jgi:hypothetical protein
MNRLCGILALCVSAVLYQPLPNSVSFSFCDRCSQCFVKCALVVLTRRGRDLPSLSGAYRRPEVESKLNVAATHHLRPVTEPPAPSPDRPKMSVEPSSGGDDGSMFVMEDGGAGDNSAPPAPATPIQVYDFNCKHVYDDTLKVIHVDSVADQIR